MHEYWQSFIQHCSRYFKERCHGHGWALICYVSYKLEPAAALLARDIRRPKRFRGFAPPLTRISPSRQKLLKSFRSTNLKKIRFNLQMNVTFSLFACAGLKVLCCFTSASSAEPEIIHPPARTTLEPSERPIMQLPDLPPSATATQAPSELSSVTGPVLARHS